jgi:hypothetical protein
MAINSSGAFSHFSPNENQVDLPHRLQPWYEAYMSALFEPDRRQIGQRIRHAEQLILRREQDLCQQPNQTIEQQALNNALHALKALRTCLGV